MVIEESMLTKGHLKKTGALRRYVSDGLGDEAFGK